MTKILNIYSSKSTEIFLKIHLENCNIFDDNFKYLLQYIFELQQNNKIDFS